MALDPNIGRIKFLRSKTAGLTPTTADIDEGELALNLVDRTIYTRNGNNIIDMGFGKGGQVNGNITASGTVKATKLEGPLTGNADSATSLQYARTINGVAFNGTSNIVIADSTKLPLAGGTVTGNLTVRDWFSTPSIRATSGYDVIESRTIKPNQIANSKFNMYFVGKNGLNSPNSGTDYGDLFTINGWAESSGGAKNSLFFAKTSKRISHYQAAYDDDVWGAPSELAYLTDNVASATKLQTTRTIGISGSSGASGSVSFDGTGNALIPLSVITQPTATNNLTIATTAFVQAVNSADTGSAATALALKTARTINGVSFNGTANIVIADSTKLPLTGGTLTGGLTAPNLTATGSIKTITLNATGAGDYSPSGQGAYLSWNRNVGSGKTDFINNRGGGPGGFDWWNGTESSYTQVMSLDSNGVLSAIGGFNGNAASATKLQTARTINGISFDGTSNITIAAETPSIATITSDATLASATTPGLYSVVEYQIAGLYGYGLLRVWSFANVWNQMFISHSSNSNGSVAVRQSWNGTAGYNAWRVIDSPNVGGNAATATKLQTARMINGVSFDGTANITIADNTKLPLTGGTISGNLNANALGVNNNSNTSGLGLSLYSGSSAGMPDYGLAFSGTATFGTHGSVVGDWATYFTMSGATNRGWIFKSGNGAGGNVASISAAGAITATSILSSGTVTAPTFSGALSGNAATATKLQTARTINGVSFDGSANITIADNTKLPLSGGTITGNIAVSGETYHKGIQYLTKSRWKSYTSNRVFGTTYLNNTPYEKEVNVKSDMGYAFLSSLKVTFTDLVTNESIVVYFGCSSNWSGGIHCAECFTVPPYTSYKAEVVRSDNITSIVTLNVLEWWERDYVA